MFPFTFSGLIKIDDIDNGEVQVIKFLALPPGNFRAFTNVALE